MKNKRVVYNLVSSITYRIVIMVLSFLISHIYLVNFGSEVNGVVSTVKQVFSYLSLLEAGVLLEAGGKEGLYIIKRFAYRNL